MNKTNLIFFFFMICAISLFAQEDQPYYEMQVDSISIKGNKITEEDIILRELTFEQGDSVDSEIINFNKERIYSLGIFNHVYLYPDSLNNNKLWIEVEESWYIYPLPFFELQDRDWDKLSYGMDVIIRNFRGRNETLRGRVTFGYDPSYLLFYSNPYLIPDEDIFFSTSLSHRTTRNKSLTAKELYGGDFDQEVTSGDISIGKRFFLYHRLALTLFYNYVETPFYIPGVSASGDRIDRFPGIGLGYSYDTRDLAQFPSNGIFSGVSLLFKGLGVDDISYQVYNFDFREYRQFFNSLTAKWRFAARVTTGETIPFYEYSFLGLGERVRGHFNEQYEGVNLYLASLELFYPLIKELKVNLDFIPLLPKELLHYRFALYAQIFGDAAGVKSKDVSFKSRDIYSGYGAGLTFLILPYSIMRFEYAFDEYQNGEFIFEVGISF